MTSDGKDSVKPTETKPQNLWMRDAVFGTVCAFFVGFLVWIADPNASLQSNGQNASNSYYNQLVQGFSEGHLYLKQNAPPALAQLANPYDPIANFAYLSNVGDMSYYKGHLYLYFGVTPVLVLFWPYHILTGSYLSDEGAVAFFFAIGFAIASALMRAVHRRYFKDVSTWMLIASMIAVGLALGLTHDDNVHQIAVMSGFAFAMLALAAIWCVLHSHQKRQLYWMSLASLAYGLAVGSRPSLLFGVAALLIPVAQVWYEAAEPHARRQVGLLFLAATGPAILIGLGLMLYNDLRFGNPFEFGWHYQLTGAYEQTEIRQFSPHYLWFNFRAYFLEPFGWSRNFPFLQSVRLPPHPPGYYPGNVEACGATFTSFPFVILALAIPWAWMNRRPTGSRLNWFIAAAFLVFVTSAFTLCLFFVANDWYRWDFLPWLMLVSVVGFLGLAQITLSFQYYSLIIRCGWFLLLGYSVVFSVLSNIESRAEVICQDGKNFFYEGRFDDALAQYRRAEALWPDCPDAHCGIGNSLVAEAHLDAGILEYQRALEIRPYYTEANNNLGYTLIQLGRVGEAIIYFERAFTNEQGFVARARASYNLGYAFERDGMAADSEKYYQKAIELQPQFMQPQIRLAWILATWPEASIRNGSQAVALMEKANQLSGGKDPTVLRTLAAAYAESGRFDDAIATAQKAIALAKQYGELNLVEKNEELLKFYLKHQAYHQSQASIPTGS
jgi:tetratricopeptide (TPR) repeat protein